MSRVRGARGDRGAIIMIVSVAMVGILCIAALVIDVGMARSARRDDQTIADLAALAGGFFLSGHGTAAASGNPFEACKAAINSVKTNQPSFAPTTTAATACASFPLDAATCMYTTPAMTPIETTLTSSRYTLVIRYPIPETEIADSRFDGVGANDGIDVASGVPDSAAQCQRMRVTFTQTNPTALAGIVGRSQIATNATSVVRGASSRIGQGIAALIMLERLNCGALQNSGQGAVTVQAPSALNPGVIQLDSAGQTVSPGTCTTNANATGYTVYGTALPSSVGGGPSIIAQSASNGNAGTIGTYSLALTNPGRGGAVYPGGLNVAPIGAPITSRQPVDTKFNGPSGQVSSLHSAAYALADSANAPNGYVRLNGGACNGSPGSDTRGATKIYVDCSTYAPDSAVFPNATDFIVHGNVNIKNGNSLVLPNVHNFFVRGCSVGGCQGSNQFSIQVAGELIVNSGENAAAAPDPFLNGTACSSRQGPGMGGTTTNWTQIATFGGAVNVSGQVRLCQTFVYMGQNASTYTRQAVINNGVSPENYPTVAACASNVPCPKDNVDTISPFSITGGGSQSDWTAPNQLTTQPTASQYVTYPFEDMALWTENSSGSNALKAQAQNLTQGIYFLPNASVLFQGLGTSPITLNAQFVTRNLNISGQGNLILNPAISDAIVSPIAGNYSLIR